jgi:dihydroflavonol-4-reductase
MTCVVTGATGHIGNVLVRELLARGESVRAVAPPGEDLTPLQGLDVDIAEADVRDVVALRQAVHPGNKVYYLAGIVSISRDRPDLVYQVNVGGARNIVQVCLERGVQRLLYTSSIHAIVPPQAGVTVDETCPIDPARVDGAYAKSKAQASLAVLDAVKQGLDAVLVCPTGVIGPYDYKVSEMGQLLLDFANNRTRASLDGAFDFVDVRDVARGQIAAFERGRTGEKYILSGERVTIDEMFRILEEITGNKAPSIKIPASIALGAADLAEFYYQIRRTRPRFTKVLVQALTSNTFISKDKVQSELGYTFRPARESIADSIRWFAEQGMIAD